MAYELASFRKCQVTPSVFKAYQTVTNTKQFLVKIQNKTASY